MINATFYQHDADRMTLAALKAIPGFTPLLKAFMKIWNEKQFLIQNMSTNLKLSEKQLPQYYHMLPPICAKLGIEVPDLYLQLDVAPNAYTAGDTKPFIVMTSGLIDTMPEELLPTILAHECGHIACHHVLYHTMWSMLQNALETFLDTDHLLSIPLQLAFAEWMRCSEFSADRAAVICDGSSEKLEEMCLRFSGFNRGVTALKVNKEAFMEQAREYRDMMMPNGTWTNKIDNTWNKLLEFLMYNQNDHPLNAVRALEAHEWAKTERYQKMNGFLSTAVLPGCEGSGALITYLREIPMPEGSKFYVGRNIDEVKTLLRNAGFLHIEAQRVTMKGNPLTKSGQVLSLRIGNKDSFAACEWFSVDAPVCIVYYEPLSEEEIIAAHPGMLRAPNSSRYYAGKDYQVAAQEFRAAGFADIECQAQRKPKKGLLNKNGEVGIIFLQGQQVFQKGEWFPENAPVRILYYVYPNG